MGNKKPKSKKIEKKEQEKMNSIEKSMLIVVILLVIALIIKSTFFDEVKGLTGQAGQFKDFVDYSVEEEYDGFLYENNILINRVYKVFIADDTLKTQIDYIDPHTGERIETILDVRYTGQVRTYLFGILPIKQFAVTARAANANEGE
jgi:hypothetical protein